VTGKNEGGAKYKAVDMEQLYGEFVKVFEPEAAERAVEVLCATWGGETHHIPRTSSLMRANRDRAIRILHGKGESFAQLASSYKLTEQQVRNICAEREGTVN
jgi:Mor family transcriptional regulator